MSDNPFRHGHGQGGNINQRIRKVLTGVQRRTVEELETAIARRAVPPHGELSPLFVGQHIPVSLFTGRAFLPERTVNEIHDLDVARRENKGVSPCKRFLFRKIQFLGKGVISPFRHGGGDGAGVRQVEPRPRKELFAPFSRAQNAVRPFGINAVEFTDMLCSALQILIGQECGQI